MHGLGPQHPCALGVWERLDSLGVGYSDLYSLSLLVDRLPRINKNRPNHTCAFIRPYASLNGNIYFISLWILFR